MNILFIGDVFGSLGIRALKNELSNLKQKHQIDLVIANCENITNCRGLCLSDYKKIKELGIDIITMGNHTWKQNDYQLVLKEPDILRPYNLDDESDLANYGVGTKVFNVGNKRIRVTNILGKSVYFKLCDLSNPFKALDKIVNSNNCDIHIVDFHAETTSEKNCAIRCFKNKVTAIIGTHTHVQTNDARIIDKTAYISDVGMTGPADGIIGAMEESLIDMFYERKDYFKLSEATGKYQFCAVVLKINDTNNQVEKIQNIYIFERG